MKDEFLCGKTHSLVARGIRVRRAVCQTRSLVFNRVSSERRQIMDSFPFLVMLLAGPALAFVSVSLSLSRRIGPQQQKT